MPSSKSVNKAVRAAERKRLRNRLVRSKTGTSISKVSGLIDAGELELAKQEVRKVISNVDKAVSKGVIHRNKGANIKSQLAKKLNTGTGVSQGVEYSEGEAEQTQVTGG